MKFLQRLGTLVLLMALIGAVRHGIQDSQPALKDVFKDHFLIGGALNDDIVSGKDPNAAAIVVKHYNTITAENVMKWQLIHPEPNTYDFEAADRFVEFGKKNGMFIVGHSLIWHNQIPRWAFMDDAGKLLSREAMLARMKDHIATVVGRYKGKVGGWDVVNEALSDEGPMNNTKWLQTVGDDYIAKAFEYAHAADPNAELYYNDFSLDKPAKRDAAVRVVKDLQARGLRIDGVGIQGHWGMDYPTNEDFEAFMKAMAPLGMKVMVTELDVDMLPNAMHYRGADINARAELRKELNPYPDGLPDAMQQQLASRYAELFSMLLKHADNIDRVTFWGVYDKTSWLNNWPVQGRTSYPLLFDRNYRAKPAFEAVVKIAAQRRQ
ncbi:MAG TPA: endo-1,4-beta-xylanase [Bacteroidota bacterium]